MKSNEKLVKDYVYYIEIESNYTKRTVDTYKKALEQFFKGKENLMINTIDEDFIRENIIEMKHAGNQPATINLKLAVLKSFFGYLKDKNILNINPVLGIKRQKLEKKLPIYLSSEDMDTFLIGINLVSNNAVRDYAMMLTFLSTGCRLSELRLLKIHQVNFSEKAITFFGKGRKERTIYMIDRLVRALHEYIKSKPKQDNDYVFTTKFGDKFTSRGIELLFQSLAQRTSIYRKGLSPHKLRHTCFTQMYIRGASLLDIRDIAGHSKMSSTEIYTHVNLDSQKKAMEMHPLNHNEFNIDFLKSFKKISKRSKKG